ncbi:MAG: hypothetical protein VKS61_01610 [Candidatus Sericytochromatia bacterium]|nr:hypothetical protein [Candidatus Sericytochromatia bacterium]
MDQGSPLAGLVSLGSTYVALPLATSALHATGLTGPAALLPFVAIPFTLGAGHFFRGDPVRGFGLGAAAYPVVVGSGLVGMWLSPKSAEVWLVNGAVVGLVGGVCYSLCVAWDATLPRATNRGRDAY